MSKRDDRLLLQDMAEAVDKILRYTEGRSFDQWQGDEFLQDAVIRNFEVIGEACRHLSHALTREHPDIDWGGIRDFRNLLVHEYFGVDATIVWEILSTDLPKLRTRLHELVGR
ncbi:MAG: DUF86 domain-containing protein [Flavobacteriales bacterium]|nr:DUF86 domain-containing protein [Flavobacteriales bacterium]HMQ76066.1 DUF86 domain-containing protein [Flavobacteriales bacterium]HMR27960.1 DUF86 domain-containing protein [Flavobacteriales bacterium]